MSINEGAVSSNGKARKGGSGATAASQDEIMSMNILAGLHHQGNRGVGRGDDPEEGKNDAQRLVGNDQINPELTGDDHDQEDLFDANVAPEHQQEVQVLPMRPHDPTRSKKDNHKEVERKRRETINAGIERLKEITETTEKNKGLILQRVADFIEDLQARKLPEDREAAERERQARADRDRAIFDRIQAEKLVEDLQLDLDATRDELRELKAETERLRTELTHLRDNSEAGKHARDDSGEAAGRAPAKRSKK